MLDASLLWPLATRLPAAFSGARLHRAALLALSRGEFGTAERLFESAAERYRQDVMVEPLARLRVHQLMARVRAGVRADQEGALLLEVERRLCRLEEIESLEFPFERVDARSLLARWIGALPAREGEHRLAA